MTGFFGAALVTLFYSTLRSATPLILGALGGVFSERAGVINIGLEGIMLIGAWTASFVSLTTGNVYIGILAAAVAGVIIAALHALASVIWTADQTVSGVAINLLASGFTEFMAVKIWGTSQSPAVASRAPDFFGLNLFVYLAFLLVLISHFFLWYTSWGLRLRSVGENPWAAETMGINVRLMKIQGVLLSGVLAGLGGASFSVGLISRFTVGMTSGRGFIALAAMIFGRWNPIGAMWACLLFGLAEGLATLFQIWNVGVPSQFLLMTPYVITMLTLAGFVGRSQPPAADGIPYEKSR
ncbi:MAG TPA: ABC transporter permease [Symbiobacteriaceae bacterium]